MSDNVPGDETKQDRLRRRRERDRLRRKRETPEEKDTRFVNPSRTCLPHFCLTKAKWTIITVGWRGVGKITELKWCSECRRATGCTSPTKRMSAVSQQRNPRSKVCVKFLLEAPFSLQKHLLVLVYRYKKAQWAVKPDLYKNDTTFLHRLARHRENHRGIAPDIINLHMNYCS